MGFGEVLASLELEFDVDENLIREDVFITPDPPFDVTFDIDRMPRSVDELFSSVQRSIDAEWGPWDSVRYNFDEDLGVPIEERHDCGDCEILTHREFTVTPLG